MTTTTTYVSGSVEFLTATVTADVELDTQPVAISIDHGETWLPASWQGDAGTTRKARTNAAVTMVRPSPFRPTHVLVKVTDSPEVPIMSAGSFSVSNP